MTDQTDPIPALSRDDPAAHSGDVAGENIAALKALFPQIITDGKVDFEVLRQLLGDAVEEGEERYGLNWKGKAKARAFALTPTLATLRPDKDDSVNWDTTQNLMIEGDNLEVLKCLRKAYAGKVKLIYIDPPYNTGGDFVYPDNYSDSLSHYLELTGQREEGGARLTSNKEGSGRFHTDWLNTILPRLELAKQMLCNEGFIAVSIDHNELSNLRSLMDETFGAENFKNIIIVRRGIKNVQAQFADIDSLSVGHEYILLYGRQASARLGKLSVQLADFQAGKWDTFWRGTDRPTMRFKIFDQKPETGQWRWSEDRTKRAIANYEEFLEEFGAQGDLDAYLLNHLQATNEELDFVRLNDENVVQYYVPPTGTKLLSNNWMDVSLKGNFTKTFDTEKHIDVMLRLIEWIVNPGEIVLDFFAGSGTTGHAIMAQNAIDEGERRFVLVQLPQPLDPNKKEQKLAADFCDELGKPRNLAELTKERLRSSGDKVRAENPGAKVDTGFRVYRLDSSNLKPWQPDIANLEASLLDSVSNILPGRTEDDLLVELLLKTGIDLTMPEVVKTIAGKFVHALGGGALMICLGDIGDADAEALGHGLADWRAELDPAGQTTFYFKDEGFASACAKANLAAILRQRLGDKIAKLASI